EDETDRRSLPELRHDFRASAMPFYNSINFGKAEAGSRAPFRREKRFERALAHLGGHAHARVAHLESSLVTIDRGAQSERAAVRHGVERVLHEVEQCFTNLAAQSADDRAASEVSLQLHRAAARALGPERAGHRHDLVADEREIDGLLAFRLHRLLSNES